MKNNFDNVPLEIEQAVMMDGAKFYANHAQCPAAAGAGQRAKTLTVAIADLAGGRIADYGLIAAAGIIATLPPAIIGFGLQRALISGLITGGVKG